MSTGSTPTADLSSAKKIPKDPRYTSKLSIFLIFSRLEALIKQAFEQFRHSALQIYLAVADDAYRDVKKYFKAEFSRVASEQGIDADTWPSERVIKDLTSRSSGQFVYASTVIKFVGYEYDSAPSQLDIILGLEPSDGKAPFAELDALYLEILSRQSEQEFLKDFLALLLAKCDDEDYGLLLKISSKAVFRKLRGMHPVLKTEPKFDVHHHSFLDFLQDASRSQQYHLTTQTATRRYLDLIVDVLVRYTTKVLKEPDYHGHEHFSPKFGDAARKYPRWIDLPLEDWEKSLLPLWSLKDELLKSPELCPSWKRGLCDECSALYIIDDLLLHLMFYRGISCPNLQSSIQAHDLRDILPLTEENQTVAGTLDELLSSLLLTLRNEPASENRVAINNLCAILRFDPAETALKIQTVSDAQNMINFIYRTNNLLAGQVAETARQATVLAIEVYSRAPLLPQLFLDSSAISIEDDFGTPPYCGTYLGKPVVIQDCSEWGINSMSQLALVLGTLSQENIPSLLGISEHEHSFILVFSYEANSSLRHWRQNMNPSVVEIQKHLCEVAKTLQYMHSLGFVLDDTLEGENIDLDSNFRVQIPPFWLSSWYCRRIPPHYKTSNVLKCSTEFHTCESSVFMYGCLLYEIYFNIDVPSGDHVNGRSTIVKNRPKEPEVDDKTWSLIQRCCEDDPKARPAMAKVVEEMESL